MSGTELLLRPQGNMNAFCHFSVAQVSSNPMLAGRVVYDMRTVLNGRFHREMRIVERV